MKKWSIEKKVAVSMLSLLSVVVLTGAMYVNGQMIGAMFEKLSSDPTGTEARVYYNTTSKVPKFYDGSAWKTIVDSSSALSNPSASPILVPDGSASAPSVAFNSDADGSGTGFYRTGTNSFGFSSNGTLVGSFTSDPLWTIGTTSGTSTHLIQAGSSTTPLKVESADTGSTSSFAGILVQRDSSTNSAGVGITFRGKDSATNEQEYAYVGGEIADNTSGSEDGAIAFRTTTAGTARTSVGSVSSLGEWDLVSGSGNTGYTLKINGASNNVASMLVRKATGSGAQVIIAAESNYGATDDEKFRVDSNGAIKAGSSSNTVGATHQFFGGANATAASTDFAILVKNNFCSGTGCGLLLFSDNVGSTIGSIIGNGSANTTSFNTSSDSRLKTNFEPIPGALSKVGEIQWSRYERISAPGVKEDGVSAQSLYEVYPQPVTPGGDNPEISPWQVDYSKLVPLLGAALKEMKAEFDAYKAAHP